MELDTRETEDPTLVEKVPAVTDADVTCHHFFMDLQQEENGLWMCPCGVIGTLAADVHRKLKFYPQRLTYNRANIRREIKRTMKRYKGGKKLPKY
jgi:hypothetical protein